LWQLGVATPSERLGDAGVQLALALELPAAPALRALGRWESMIADYSSYEMSIHEHPLALLRPELGEDVATSRDLARLRHGSGVSVAGLVLARQRPGTASGIVFVLLEDELGTINLIVPPAVYERHRLSIRAEPLVLAHGRLERHPKAGGAINVIVDRMAPLAAPGRPLASLTELASRRGPQSPPDRVPASADGCESADARERERSGADFRAVAPAVMSFAQGRRR